MTTHRKIVKDALEPEFSFKVVDKLDDPPMRVARHSKTIELDKSFYDTEYDESLYFLIRWGIHHVRTNQNYMQADENALKDYLNRGLDFGKLSTVFLYLNIDRPENIERKEKIFKLYSFHK